MKRQILFVFSLVLLGLPAAYAGDVDAIMKGLSRSPDDRFPSMKALLDVLRHDPAQRRKRWIAAAAGVAVAAVVVGLVAFTVYRRQLCGAGDAYAAGFLYGYTQGLGLGLCGRIAAIAAAEVISHNGARPERNLAELVQEKLGLLPIKPRE